MMIRCYHVDHHEDHELAEASVGLDAAPPWAVAVLLWSPKSK